MNRFRIVFLSAFLALSGAAAGIASGAANGTLAGSVGPGFSISLRDAGGSVVTNLAPGTYDLSVDDKATEHNFHLTGPGVDVSTEIETLEQKTFSVTLQDGATYTFVCDPHSGRMRGSFTVGTASGGGDTGGGGTGGTGGGTGGTGGTPPAKPSAPVGAKLVLQTGPGFAISLKTAAGKKVTRLRPGGYTILVRDRSASHNARLKGAGAARVTTVPFVGTQTWKVVLRKGTLVFQCDPHASAMRGSVVVAP
jgi:plastocyanin